MYYQVAILTQIKPMFLPVLYTRRIPWPFHWRHYILLQSSSNFLDRQLFHFSSVKFLMLLLVIFLLNLESSICRNRLHNTKTRWKELKIRWWRLLVQIRKVQDCTKPWTGLYTLSLTNSCQGLGLCKGKWFKQEFDLMFISA